MKPEQAKPRVGANTLQKGLSAGNDQEWFDNVLEPLLDRVHAFGFEATAEDLLDALWVSRPPLHPEIKPFPKLEPEAPPKSVITPPPGPSIASEPASLAHDVYYGDDAALASITSSRREHGRRVMVLAGRALSDPLRLAESLLPLAKRRVLTRPRQLDVHAMVDRYCRNGGIWERQVVRDRELPYEILLVLEDTYSVRFWQALADELAAVFKDVLRLRVRRFSLRWEGAEALVAEGNRKGGIPARSLLSLARRQLPVLLSDCTSPPWQDGSMGELLHTWSRIHPTTLLLPFSVELARRTEFRRFLPSHARVEPHGEIAWTGTGGTDVPVFVTQATPTWLGAWARAVAPAREDFTSAVFVSRERRELLIAPATGTGKPDPVDANPTLARFRELVTPAAAGLAEVLAAVPLYPPVMRLVQQALCPGTTHNHLAEFFYSGLIYRVPNQDVSRFPDKVLYEFLPVMEGQRSLRQRLLDGTTYEEPEKILNLVGEYLAQEFGDSGKWFEAFLAGSGEVDDLDGVDLPPELGPFARVFGEVMERGRRSRKGLRLKEVGEALDRHWGAKASGKRLETFKLGKLPAELMAKPVDEPVKQHLPAAEQPKIRSVAMRRFNQVEDYEIPAQELGAADHAFLMVKVWARLGLVSLRPVESPNPKPSRETLRIFSNLLNASPSELKQISDSWLMLNMVDPISIEKSMSSDQLVLDFVQR